jgi:hypothetical protein
MFGQIGQFANLLKSARELQTQMTKLQEELAARRYTADAGAGMVTATVDGKGTLVGVKIDPKAVADVELLEDLVTAAVAAAVARSQDAMKNELGMLKGGINLPGLTEMLSPPPNP